MGKVTVLTISFLIACVASVVIYGQFLYESKPVEIIKPNGLVYEFDESNWRSMFEGEWIVAIIAPWCPACKHSEKLWPTLAKSLKEIKIGVGKVDVTKTPELSGRFLVTALPTIYHIKNGILRQYRGPRNHDALFELADKQTWKDIEPVSSYWHPKGVVMNIMSKFFTFSQYLKTLNVNLQEYFGLPYWAAYIFFAIVTILIGSVLGLLLVCLIDVFNWLSNDGTEKYIRGPNDTIVDEELFDEEIIDELADVPNLEQNVNGEVQLVYKNDDEHCDDEEGSDTSDEEKISNDEDDGDDDSIVEEEGSKVEKIQKKSPAKLAVSKVVEQLEDMVDKSAEIDETNENIEVRKRRVRKAD